MKPEQIWILPGPQLLSSLEVPSTATPVLPARPVPWPRACRRTRSLGEAQDVEEMYELWLQTDTISILALPVTCCVTLGSKLPFLNLVVLYLFSRESKSLPDRVVV